MDRFKIGDKVKLIKRLDWWIVETNPINKIGIVVAKECGEKFLVVKWDKDTKGIYY